MYFSPQRYFSFRLNDCIKEHNEKKGVGGILYETYYCTLFKMKEKMSHTPFVLIFSIYHFLKKNIYEVHVFCRAKCTMLFQLM